MRRIVSIAAAFSLIFLALGIGMRTMLRISTVNKERRDHDKAKELAASMAADVPETQSIWDYLHKNTDPPAAQQVTEQGTGDTEISTEDGSGAVEQTEPVETISPTQPPTSDPLVIYVH